MCILFAFISKDPSKSGYQLIVANNRDELYTRPTKAASWWGEHCISGLDEEPGREGGTWFGVSTQGKLATLLNILKNGAPDKDKKGRGHLVTEFLQSNQSAEEYLAPLSEEREEYNGYNLILLEYNKSDKRWSTRYFSNLDDDSPCELKEEFIAFGNSTYNKSWCKVRHGKEQFKSIVQKHSSSDPSKLTDALISLLNDSCPHLPDPQLELQGKGYLPEKIMRERSGIYVESKEIKYGTRTNTVLLVDQHGHGTYTERTMKQPIDPYNPQWETNSIQFDIDPTATKL